jgi:hypothetical protein
MKRMVFLMLLLLCSVASFSQTESGDVEVYLNTIIDNMPGDSGDDYRLPNASELTAWESCVTNIVNGNLATARTFADQVNYEIVDYTHTEGTGGNFWVLKEKDTQSNYWGTYVFAIGYTRELVLQAPHSEFDFNTGKQAIYSFVRLYNYALFLNGTHRCNHSQASTCSGTTSVCGVSGQAFRISDLAHNVNDAYQTATEVVYNLVPESVFVQLHGFTKLETDPYVILSNGTDDTPAGEDYAATFENELFAQDNTLTFQTAHLDNWTRLVGFTNTQGRYINQSTNACNSSATSTTGRFLHIEQEKTKLRDDVTGWQKVMNALDGTFLATVSVDEVIQVKLQSENPFTNSIQFSAEGVKQVSLISLTGSELYSKKNSSHQVDFVIDTQKLPHGLYILQVMTNKGIYTKKLIRK